MIMHADQLHVDAQTVRRLVEVQFPQWRALPVTQLRTAGTVNAIFRIGEDLAARFPLVGQDPAQGRASLVAEAQATRELADAATVPTSLPVGDRGAGRRLSASVERPDLAVRPRCDGRGPRSVDGVRS